MSLAGTVWVLGLGEQRTPEGASTADRLGAVCRQVVNRAINRARKCAPAASAGEFRDRAATGSRVSFSPSPFVLVMARNGQVEVINMNASRTSVAHTRLGPGPTVSRVSVTGKDGDYRLEAMNAERGSQDIGVRIATRILAPGFGVLATLLADRFRSTYPDGVPGTHILPTVDLLPNVTLNQIASEEGVDDRFAPRTDLTYAPENAAGLEAARFVMKSLPGTGEFSHAVLDYAGEIGISTWFDIPIRQHRFPLDGDGWKGTGGRRSGAAG